MSGDQIKQLHHAGGINLRVAAITRANGMFPVAQIHECDGDLVGLEFLAGEFCERLMDGVVHEGLQSADACLARWRAFWLRQSCRRQCQREETDGNNGKVKGIFHAVAFNHSWTRMNTDNPDNPFAGVSTLLPY